MANPDTPPPGYSVKLWFVERGHRGGCELVYRWARERPLTYLLQKYGPAPGYVKVLPLADGHTTPGAAVSAYCRSKRLMADRMLQQSIDLRADAAAAEKALEDHNG